MSNPMSDSAVTLSELDQIAFELEEWIRQPDWAEKFTLQDMVDWASDKRPIHIVQKLRQISARQGAPELTEGKRKDPAPLVVEALTIAEDVLSRSPYSTAIWPNGMHPQTGIEKIRAALASLSSTE